MQLDSLDEGAAFVLETCKIRRMIFQTLSQMKKMLGHLDKWLDAATAHAKERSFDPNVFLSLRLAPDQFALVRQVQSSCDTIKLAAARLAGKTPPSHPDTETDDRRAARAHSVGARLPRRIRRKRLRRRRHPHDRQPRWEGKVMTGSDYFLEHAVPNFFFHVTHAYAILRHNGVVFGKKDYLGPLSLRAP